MVSARWAHCGPILAKRVELARASWSSLNIKTKSADEEWIAEPSPKILEVRKTPQIKYAYYTEHQVNLEGHIDAS